MVLNFPSEGYNLTENPQVLPQILLRSECAKVFVEFLQISQTATAKNHVILKVDFKTPCEDYEGARLSMDVEFELGSTGSDDSQPGLKPGKMLVKPVPYTLSSTSSARTFQIRVHPNLPFGYIVNTLLHYGLHDFYFTNIDDRYYGCRDFV